MARNIQFNYLYRDAGNYKIYGEEIFSNPTEIPPQEIEIKIKEALIDGEFFDPMSWGIKRLRFVEWDDDLDHSWNEFESVEETDEVNPNSKNVNDFIETITKTKNNL